MRVSATDFRVHLKDWANQVASGGDALVVERHGFQMGAFISCARYEKLLRLERLEGSEQTDAPIEVPREHPDTMPVEELERIYRATANTDETDMQWWRGKAFISLRAKGRSPEPPW